MPPVRALPSAVAVLAALAAPAGRAGGAPCSPAEAILVDGLGTPADDLARAAEDAGAVAPDLRLVRRAGLRRVTLCWEGPAVPWAERLALAPDGERWWTVVSPRLDLVLNTTHPEGGNDGLLWAGRGLSTMLSGGVAGRSGAFSAQIAPAVAWQQNDWFEIVPTGGTGDLAFASPFYGANLDLPQRFGAGPFASFSPGESFVRVDALGVGVGVSTERIWLGPGQRTSLLGSGTAPGFPHLLLETSGPVDVWVGDLEVHALWGRLSRSTYFDGGDAADGHPWLALLALGFEPRWVPGLVVGAARVVLQPWDELVDDWFVPFLGVATKGGLGIPQEPGNENSPLDNQIGVLWFRWVLPSAGFEVWGEWGKEDREVSAAGLARELGRTAAWVAGLQKVFAGSGTRWVRFQAEIAQLQDVRPDYYYSWYTHPNDLSYTHGGQLLGAWTGPGGNSQTAALDVFFRRGRLGGFVERVERNEGYYYAAVEPTDRSRDVQLGGGVRGVFFAGPLEVAFESAFAHRWDRDFLGEDAGNLRLALQVAYRVAR
jgi:hypothetical protein